MPQCVVCLGPSEFGFLITFGSTASTSILFPPSTCNNNRAYCITLQRCLAQLAIKIRVYRVFAIVHVVAIQRGQIHSALLTATMTAAESAVVQECMPCSPPC